MILFVLKKVVLTSWITQHLNVKRKLNPCFMAKCWVFRHVKMQQFQKIASFLCLLQQFPGIRVISLLGKAIASVAASLRNYIYRLAAFTIKITLASQQQQLWDPTCDVPYHLDIIKNTVQGNHCLIIQLADTNGV